MNNSTRGPDRVLLIGAIVVGVIVIGAALVALTRSEPAALDPNSPEGTAQRYVQAVLDGDSITVRDLLLEGEDCDLGPRYVGNNTVRARLIDTAVDGDTAVVEIDVIFSGGDPLFGGYGYEERAQIELELTADGWRVDPNSWPYFFCEVNR
jgi:hypothetical protein